MFTVYTQLVQPVDRESQILHKNIIQVKPDPPFARWRGWSARLVSCSSLVLMLQRRVPPPSSSIIIMSSSECVHSCQEHLHRSPGSQSRLFSVANMVRNRFQYCTVSFNISPLLFTSWLSLWHLHLHSIHSLLPSLPPDCHCHSDNDSMVASRQWRC